MNGTTQPSIDNIQVHSTLAPSHGTEPTPGLPVKNGRISVKYVAPTLQWRTLSQSISTDIT